MSDIELRAATTATQRGRVLNGHAAVFYEETVIAGLFRERILPGAFKESLGRDDIFALANHDYKTVLGRTSAGTLELWEDAKGLAFSLTLPDNTVGNDLAESVGRFDTRGCSFGFLVRSEDWDDNGELPLRTLKKVDLSEITITPIPAYDGTDVCLRSGSLSPSVIFSRMRMKQRMLESGVSPFS